MNEQLLRKLQAEILETVWADLKEHHEAGRLVMITPELDIVDVAADMVADDTDVIKAWLAQRKMFRLTPQQVEQLEKDSNRKFRFIIVRPYVLIQAVEQ